jgi:hypothetical protein
MTLGNQLSSLVARKIRGKVGTRNCARFRVYDNTTGQLHGFLEFHRSSSSESL